MEDNKIFYEFRNDLFSAISSVCEKYNFNGIKVTKDYFDKTVKWMQEHDFWNDDIEN